MKLGVWETEICESSQFGLIDEKLEQKPKAYADWTNLYLPNFTDWELGDFVLFRPHNPDFFQDKIQRWQGTTFSKQDAIWTHVGVYVGNGKLIDSLVSGGIARRSIATWLNEGWVSVRYRPGLDADSRNAMVKAVEDCSGRGYAHVAAASAAIVNALPTRFKSLFNSQYRQEYHGRLYCAQVAERSLLAGDNKRIGSSDAPMPVPASFAASPLLEWRTLGWRIAA